MKYSIYFAVLLLASCASLEEMHQKIMHRIPTYLSNGIFVSVSTGHDTNSGTNRLEPVKNVQTGISNAVKLGITNIYIARGVYTPGNGLNAATYGVTITNNNLHISGGYETDFRTIRVGYSEWDCQKLFGPVVSILNCTNVLVERVVVRNGKADTEACGIYVNMVSNLMLINSIVSNNSNYSIFSVSGGMVSRSSSICLSNMLFNNNYGWTGGLVILDTDYDLDLCNIFSNFAYGPVGGINFHNSSRGTMKNCIVCNNISSNFGGIIVYYNHYSYIYNNAITNNSSIGSVNSSIWLAYNTGFTNLTLSNNIFSGPSFSTQFMIREQGAGDFVGHKIINNIFITNTISYLYYDYDGSNIISNQNWTNINITNYTGAAVASGNRVTNM